MADKKVLKISERTGVPVKVNKKAKPTKIQPVASRDIPHICVCCGKEYQKLQTNFPIARSPLFAANDGYYPVCKNCLREFYKQLLDYFCDNEDRAMERICAMTDWYFSPDILEEAHSAGCVEKDPVLYPGKQLGRRAWASKTYLDTITEGRNVVVADESEFDALESEGKITVSSEGRERWGLNWQAEEYPLLDKHFETLRKKSVNPDEQDLLIRQLCEIYILQYRARCKGDVGEYDKAAKLYKTYYDSGGFKSGINNDDSFNQSLGVMNLIVEGMTPSEYYKDKKLFNDEDGIVNYINRILKRPMKNLLTGGKELDDEFVIKDGDEL